ncbi:MAG: hypothetical protein ACI4AA_06745 [Lachnospiraceae bacterium]
MGVNLLQHVYNLADTFIVGRFLGVDALASVGWKVTVLKRGMIVLQYLQRAADMNRTECCQ